MAVSISDSFPSQPIVSSPAFDPVQSPAEDATDTVRISQDAQIRLLVQQGESPAEIALDLGVAAMTVMTYLDVTLLPPLPISESQDGPSPTASIPAMG